MRVAFVLTTHHDAHLTAGTAMIHLLEVLGKLPLDPFIYLFLNEPTEATQAWGLTFQTDPRIDLEVVKDQGGGLTYTWNAGIIKGMGAGCEVFVLLNDDLRVNETLVDLILAAASPEDLAICGPGTLPGGAPYNPESWVYLRRQALQPRLDRRPMQLWHGLNGFCLAFHRNLLEANTFDGLHFFDPKIPFGGNETEFGKRWFLQGGVCAAVYSAFVDHLKRSSWRALPSKTKAVKVSPPPSLALTPPLESTATPVTVVSFASVIELDSVPKVEASGSAHYTLLVCGVEKGRHLPPAWNGWTLLGQRNRRWNPRLRLKHLLGSKVWSRPQQHLILLETPRDLSIDPCFLASATLPPSLPNIAALRRHPTFPTLSSFFDEKEAMNGPMMHRFKSDPGPTTVVPQAYRLYPSLWLLNEETHKFLSIVLDMGIRVDWDFDFLVSWACFETGLEPLVIDPLWLYRLKLD
jgi:hypothetical protein